MGQFWCSRSLSRQYATCSVFYRICRQYCPQINKHKNALYTKPRCDVYANNIFLNLRFFFSFYQEYKQQFQIVEKIINGTSALKVLLVLTGE